MINLSIKYKLLAAFFLISFVPFFIISHLSIIAVKDSIYGAQIQKLFTGANLTAEKINSFIADNINSLSIESQFPTCGEFLEAGSDKKRELAHHLAQIVKLLSQKENEIFIQSYFYMDLTGEAVFSSDAAMSGMTFKNLPFFEKPVMSGIPECVLISGDKNSGFYFSAPVRNDKKAVIGVACVKYNFSVIQHFASKCNGMAGEGSFAMINGEDGACIACGEFPQLITNNNAPGAAVEKSLTHGYPVFKIAGGEYHYAGAELVKNKRWMVFFLQPAKAFYEVVGKQLNMIFVFMVLIIIAVFGGAWLVWKKITGPIEYLTGAVKKFSIDSPNAKVTVDSGDEIGVLAESFNQMDERLKAALYKLKESDKIWQFALIGSGDGVWDWDIKSGNIFLSKRWKEMFGFEHPGDFARLDCILNIIHESDLKALNEKLARCLNGEEEAFVNEHRMRCADGKYRWTLSRGRIVSHDENGRPSRFIGTNADITAIKEAEENYKTARDLAEKANMLKSQFLANMSHEIRTPMNGIIGFAKLLSMGELYPGQKEYIDIIKVSAEHLMNIIDDILDFSKIESGKLKIMSAPFAIRDLVSEVRDFTRPLFTDKYIVFEASAAPEIENIEITADRQRLRQALINLVSNAAKFTERGKIKFYIEKTAAKDGAGMLRFSVSDTGIGIEAGRLDEIFNAFHQLDESYTKKFAGTGLGLAITKNLIGLMGGTVGVKSDYGRGSEFFFEIPLIIKSENILKSIGSEEMTFNNAGRDNYKGMNALVADDDSTSLLLIKTILETRDFNVKTAENGRIAIDMLNAETFDLVIMDIQMPEIDGMAVIRSIREKDLASGRKTPVIVASAYAGTDELKSFADCGADDCISKPIEFESFWAKIKLNLKK